MNSHSYDYQYKAPQFLTNDKFQQTNTTVPKTGSLHPLLQPLNIFCAKIIDPSGSIVEPQFVLFSGERNLGRGQNYSPHQSPAPYVPRVVFTVLAFFSVKNKGTVLRTRLRMIRKRPLVYLIYVQHASKPLYYRALVIKVLPYPSPLLISSAFNCYSTACIFTSTKKKKWYMVGW